MLMAQSCETLLGTDQWFSTTVDNFLVVHTR